MFNYMILEKVVMMNNTLISVVVPVYNGESLLQKCIESIARQTFTNIEIIIIDDGSTDSTIDIVETLRKSDDRIVLIKSEHKGVVSARRTGINHARGEYLSFVDADDCLNDNSIEILANYIETNKADIAVGCANTVYSDGMIRGGLRRTLPEGVYQGENLKELFKYMIYDEKLGGEGVIGTAWAALFRKDILKKATIRIPEGLTYGEDAALMYISLLKADCVYLGNDYVYNYFRHEDSASTSKRRDAFNEISEFYCFMSNEFQDYNVEYGLIRQLKLYTCALLRMAINANFPINIQAAYFLPNQVVKQLIGKRVLIYGTGGVGRSLYVQLKQADVCEEIFLCDGKLAGSNVEGQEVLSPEKSLKNRIDYILIANSDSKVRKSIKNELYNKGMPEESILDINPHKSESLWTIIPDLDINGDCL